MQFNAKAVTIGLVFCAALASGCTITPAKFSGKGQIASTSLLVGDKASFKLKADTCDMTKVKSKFEFSDTNAPAFPGGGVKLEAEILGDLDCNTLLVNGFSCQGTTPGSAALLTLMRYTSTNKHYPGTGFLAAVFTDKGGKTGVGLDEMAIVIGPVPSLTLPSGEVLLSGPYASYLNQGVLEKGNLKAGHCADPTLPEKEIYSTKDK
jgi:hypothetical protein